MGICCSKKEPPPAKPGKVAAAAISDGKAKRPAQQPKRAAGSKSAVSVVKATDAAAAAAPGEDEKKKKKRAGVQEAAAVKQQPQPLPVVVVPSAPVRTSSCTKEEVDAILIQCGRLSRSSSGAGRAASSDAGGHRRRRSSGSKRSYDFDQQGGADEECEWERQGAAAVSRPSPHRGSPQRRRSGSRERSGVGGGGSGSRRASRSPGRRADGAAASVAAAAAGSGGGERSRQQQPGKMVSVPAREKGKRCASPRASSPARVAPAAAAWNENAGGGPTPALSRSSSRKAEQSPYRRSPMAEIDENTLRNSGHNAKPQQKKSTEIAVAGTPKKAAARGKVPTAETAEDATVVAASETRAHSSKTITTRSATASIVAESLGQRPTCQPGCRSRRASRDFDQNPGSYATQLLEDIQNYHQQSTTSASATPATPSLSLPACVAKACSIMEADLNSSSENRTNEYEPGLSADDKGSVNAPPLGSDGCVESIAARKHVTTPAAVRDSRAENEPQESAGSNSVSGQPWTPSWEPTSVESTDRTWSTSDEVVEQQSGSHGGHCSPMNRPRQSKQRPSQHEHCGRSRAGSGNGSSLHRGRSAHRGGGSGSVASGRSGVRVVSATS